MNRCTPVAHQVVGQAHALPTPPSTCWPRGDWWTLLHVLGAAGLGEQQPFLRHRAAAQAATPADGSTEMRLERVAKDLRPR